MYPAMQTYITGDACLQNWIEAQRRRYKIMVERNGAIRCGTDGKVR